MSKSVSLINYATRKIGQLAEIRALLRAAKRNNVLMIGLRILCYLALLIIVSSVIALSAAMSFGKCTQSGDFVECSSSLAQGAANAANMVLLTSVFTLVPMLLALGGLFFLIRNGYRRFRNTG